MLLTLILCVVVGYVTLALPIAVVVGWALRSPLEPYASEPAAYPAAAARTVTLAG